MIPIGDDAPLYRRPIVVWVLLASNVVIFLLQWRLPEARVEGLIKRLGLTPVDFIDKWQAVLGDPGLLLSGPVDWLTVGVLPILSCQLLHAGPLHLLGNMLFLAVFGDNVEGRLGRWRFLGLYLLSGLAALLMHCWMTPASRLPVVGASGAIAGLLGAYLLLFPRAHILLLLPIFVFFTVIELPAWLVLIAWFALQLPQVQGVLGWLSVEGVAWWAHVGGFLAGMALIPLLCLGNPAPEQRRRRRPGAGRRAGM